MRTTTAAQERVIANAVVLAATELLFTSMRKHFPCPTLAEVVTIHNGQGLRAEDRDATGRYHVYAAGGLVGRHSASLNDRPFVVIGRKGTAGKPTYAPFGGWVIDTAYYAQSKDEKRLDCEFLYYAISSLDFSGDIISTAIPGINRTSIYQHTIPLPPREIQEATVRFLKAAADKSVTTLPVLPSPLQAVRKTVIRVKELSAKIEEARSLRQGAIQELTAFIPAMGRKRLGQVKAPVTPLRTWLNGQNDGIQTGPFGAQLSSTEFTISGVPVLTIGNVQYGGLKLDALKFVSEEKADQLARYRIKQGDFLFARMGTVGRCCIVPKEAEDWLINYHIIRVRLDSTRVEPRYIHWAIQASEEVEEYLGEKIRGATREGVNSAIVGGIPCRVPPIPEQLRIIEYLDDLQAKVDAVKKLQEETEEELNALMPSILSRAFTGAL